jgi:hypothetical protein
MDDAQRIYYKNKLFFQSNNFPIEENKSDLPLISNFKSKVWDDDWIQGLPELRKLIITVIAL